MAAGSIKQVVFDIGNVVVRWSPLEIVRLTFGDTDHAQVEAKARAIFQSDTWLNLNKGLITEAEANAQYQRDLGFSALEAECLFYYVKQTQLLIYGTVDLIERIKAAGYGVYALTDNVHDIVAHLKATYSFWSLFDGATVSAEEGVLKPQPEIYHALLSDYHLAPADSVFIDDMLHNVQGAEAVGMAAIQFVNAAQCEAELKALGLVF